MIQKRSWIDEMNVLGQQRIPYFFFIDFEFQKPIVVPLSEWPEHWSYQSALHSIGNTNPSPRDAISFGSDAMTYDDYLTGFTVVMNHLKYGNSFLTNYTIATRVSTNYTAQELFSSTYAKYKLCIPEHCVVFSPETFVDIRSSRITSYPMKGTIDATIPDAAAILLSDKKEMAEHFTIVDLIRNDLSRVSRKVSVPKFRYLDLVNTHKGSLWQASSMITGVLDDGYLDRLGDIFVALLPAGSITGAPKPKTIEIIKEAEVVDRGYYTGVFGVFDGMNVESAVAIRYMEPLGNNWLYRSGGGITAKSDPMSEYLESLNKVYVPISRIHKDSTSATMSVVTAQ